MSGYTENSFDKKAKRGKNNLKLMGKLAATIGTGGYAAHKSSQSTNQPSNTNTNVSIAGCLIGLLFVIIGFVLAFVFTDFDSYYAIVISLLGLLLLFEVIYKYTDGCGLIGLLTMFFLFLSPPLIKTVRIHEAAKIIQEKEFLNSYHISSNSVYLQSSFNGSRFDPDDDIKVSFHGVLLKDNYEKFYYLHLSYYFFVSYENKDKILNDSNVLQYYITKKYKEASDTNEEGNIDFKGYPLLLHTRNGSDISLSPEEDIIRAKSRFHSHHADYIRIHTYFIISKDQVYQILNEDIVGIECLLQITGEDKHLNIPVKPRMLRQLKDRIKLIDTELDNIIETL